MRIGSAMRGSPLDIQWLFEIQSLPAFVEEIPFVEQTLIGINASFELVQLDASGWIIEQPTVRCGDWKETCSAPVGARTCKEHRHIVPLDFLINDVEVDRTQRRHRKIASP